MADMHRGSLLLKLAMAQELWPENDHDWLRDELQAIPDWHVEGWRLARRMMLRILSDFSEFRDEFLSPTPRDDVDKIVGAYRYEPHELCLKSKCFGPGLVSHEMGHRVWDNICCQGWSVQFWNVFFDAYITLYESTPLHSWYDWKEFFADGYMVMAAEGQDYVTTDWEPKLINTPKMPNWLRNYEQEYPRLTLYMRSLFEERSL